MYSKPLISAINAYAKFEENPSNILQIEIGKESDYEQTDAQGGVYHNTLDASE